ncbi:hypothetical protein ACPV5O_25605 [Vibrio maritimus]|uniref:hypothetical protein n=1 Tax=Vibrio maritimus TaxID=990268 RepID=UPI0040697991
MTRFSLGGHTPASMLPFEGFGVQHFKILMLIQQVELISKQPGSGQLRATQVRPTKYPR